MRPLSLAASLATSLALVAGGARAQPTAATPLPDKHIPPSVVMEVRALEGQFDLALAHDCAPERCASKGCVYRDHVVVDLPSGSSLPGLGQNEGVGSVPPQQYLTQARCEFAHEKAVSPRDAQALVKRLEQRLSKGWLQVTVGRQLLEPVSPALAESPDPQPKPPAPAPQTPEPPLPAASWDSAVALRELWQSLLPHFSWMIALVLGTLATLTIIWALRRLGRESLEEKAMAAQLAAGLGPAQRDASSTTQEGAPQGAPDETATPAAAAALASSALEAQRQRWAERVAQARPGQVGDGLGELLREWLRAGELPLLAKAILLFGDRLTSAFPSDGELAARKVALAEYLREVDPAKLPDDAQFFRTLERHAVSAALLAQSDAETFRSLREELGSGGLVALLGRLGPRHGALLFALTPPDVRGEVARALPPQLRWAVARALLASNRMSTEDRQYLFTALDAVRTGAELPPALAAAEERLVDRGRVVDAAGALSVLLPLLDEEARRSLFADALRRGGGVHPGWYEDILYPAMLLGLPPELQGDLLLEVEVRGLAGWLSAQDGASQERLEALLTPTLKNAVKANLSFASRQEQLRLSEQGRVELAAGLRRLVARGKVSFGELLV